MAKKKLELSKAVKGLLKGEIKRFVTIIEKYYPEGKDKREILKKFEEISALVGKVLD